MRPLTQPRPTRHAWRRNAANQKTVPQLGVSATGNATRNLAQPSSVTGASELFLDQALAEHEQAHGGPAEKQRHISAERQALEAGWHWRARQLNSIEELTQMPFGRILDQMAGSGDEETGCWDRPKCGRREVSANSATWFDVRLPAAPFFASRKTSSR